VLGLVTVHKNIDKFAALSKGYDSP